MEKEGVTKKSRSFSSLQLRKKNMYMHARKQQLLCTVQLLCIHFEMCPFRQKISVSQNRIAIFTIVLYTVRIYTIHPPTVTAWFSKNNYNVA